MRILNNVTQLKSMILKYEEMIIKKKQASVISEWKRFEEATQVPLWKHFGERHEVKHISQQSKGPQYLSQVVSNCCTRKNKVADIGL